jgi:hypothetical protein
MPSNRLYLHRTPALERALSLVTEVAGVPASASLPKKLEAWLEFSTQRVEEELAYDSRLHAYDELAQVAGRRERVKRNTREAAKHGLL